MKENGIFSGFNSETNQNKKAKYVNITIDPADKNLIIDGKKYYAPWALQYLSQGHYRLPNGEFYRYEGKDNA